MSLGPGTRLGPYEIRSRLGAGGMGEVYRATHLKLLRDVAIKVLPSDLATDPERLKRFEREARAASALNHPAIVTIHDIDDWNGTRFIAMELVEGKTLRERLIEGRLSTKEVLGIATQIAEGLARAHDAGIVHRDLKPDNVMIAPDGRVKILDFGLAKLTFAAAHADDETGTATETTAHGIAFGTIPYMSPEQAAGQPVGHHSDQFSFGVMLYEMLCGARPFEGDSAAMVLSAILRDSPRPPRSLRPDTPRDLERVVQRCLEKSPQQRYESTKRLGAALRECETRLAEASARSARRHTVAAAFALLLAATGVGAWLWLRGADVRWAEREALPEIARLIEAGHLYEAFSLARQAQAYIPDNVELQTLLERITIPISIVTEPAGADVAVSGYATPEAPWEPLGQTPLQGVRIPYALMRWQISKAGFETFEGAPFGEGPFVAFARGFPLDPAGTRPDGMVRVPGGPVVKPEFPMAQVDDFWLDRYEVTNRQFKAFVDAGGYQKKEYWTAVLEAAGETLSWEDAMSRFRDPTGRPGPSTWELGTYADDRAHDPVGGVSWYEAAAYCQYAGGQLPSIYHWYKAAAQDQLSDIVRVSNFGGRGPATVGSHRGLGDYGTFDMAGNVKEWCWNAAGDRRYILGGAWNEPTYMFRLDPDAREPSERLATHGVRCARFPGAVEPGLLAPIQRVPLDVAPVSDEVFQAYRRMYAYDRTDLAARIDAVDDTSPQWRKETVSFRAAYPNERVIAQVFLPRGVPPPYQTVVWFPGNDAFFLPSSATLASAYLFDFIPRSGRALVYPIYKGMYERRAPFSRVGNEWRDMVIAWAKDLGRTIDYLETRDDIDQKKLGYYGFSLGSALGPTVTAVDDRFAASVLLAGGIPLETIPEIFVPNFAPRSTVPTLMISGRDDFVFPAASSQRPLFDLLGAPAKDKRHAVLEGGHIPADRREIIREVLGWFDRYLGPVDQIGAAGGGIP